MEFSNVFLSFALTLAVGASMGLGACLSFFVKGENKRFLTLSLSFSAGIMIYVSFMAILPEGMEAIEAHLGERGHLLGLLGFFAGMIITALVEGLVHRMGGHDHGHDHGHSHAHSHGSNPAYGHDSSIHKEHINKLGLVSAIAIALHNFPEGLALFTAGLKDISMALPIAAAILMHNIPLSIAIAIPLYYSTKSKAKAFFYTLLVGLFQPLGALAGYMLLSNHLNDFVFGILFTIVAGIMVFVSLDELLPMAHKHDDHHLAIYGAIVGMLIMALSMVFFGHSHH